MEIVYSKELVTRVVEELGIKDLASATIGEVVLLAMRLEALTGVRFIRMDQGVPGLDPCSVGLEAEKAVLSSKIAAVYPPAEGVAELKNETSRFLEAFLDIDLPAACCIPTVGAVQASFGAFTACTQFDTKRKRILFIDPGFPIQKSQLRIIGAEWESFDVHDFRGEGLHSKLEEYLSSGEIAALVYSNPNNPAWICFTESELHTIGDLATKYGVIVIEDLAYFGMDFRRDYGDPFRGPYPPTVARYAKNYILLLSASKIFSYAGQRIGVMAISESLYKMDAPQLAARYSTGGTFGSILTASILYMITSGATHSTQYGFAAMLRAANEGQVDFVKTTSEYARRTKLMKQLFLKNGFHIVYSKDMEEPIGDGFFFTIGYGDMSSGELMQELIYYGISSISLCTTGSTKDGVRACCSRMDDGSFEILGQRLALFAADHGL